MLEVAFYSFKHPDDISVVDIEKCGIRSLVDVGKWLVHILKSQFKHDELATNLKKFIDTD